MFDWILNTFFVQKDKPSPEAFPIPRGQLREVLGAQKDPAAGAAGRKITWDTPGEADLLFFFRGCRGLNMRERKETADERAALRAREHA